MIRRRFAQLPILGLLVLWSPDGRTATPDTPRWWLQTRAIYTPAACTGAGSNLMKFYGCPGALDEVIASFAELSNVWHKAQAFHCNVIYLVDYWDDGYDAKGTYEPSRKLGGEAALREAIAEIHRQGGRVILYVEPFIISRTTDFGQAMGPLWGIMDANGRFYDYPGTTGKFYLMQPRSNWAAHLETVCRRLVGDYGADGIFLDSYGCRTGWKDHHPEHPGADADGWFDAGAVELAARIRAAVRDENPEAIVMTECDVQATLNAVTDGALEESLATLERLAWYREGKTHPIFISEFSLARMDEILDRGYGVTLNPWWSDFDWPEERDFEKWLEVDMDLGGNRSKAQRAMREFVKVYNLLHANGIVFPPQIDFEYLLRQTLPFTCDTLELTTEERTARFRAAVRFAREQLPSLDPRSATTPLAHLAAQLSRARSQ